jgi:hypothetical protein
MKKKILITIVFLSIILLFTIKMQTSSIPPEKTLEAAFACSGARVVSSEIYFTGKSESGSIKSMEEMKRLLLTISKAFGVENSDPNINNVENESTSGVELNCSKDSFRNIHISVVKDKSGGDAEKCYVNASMVDTSETPVLEEIGEKVTAALQRNGIDIKANSSISGNFNGKLNDNKLNEICKVIFEYTHARKVEGIRDLSLISVSAYTQDIGKSIEVNGKKINLNLAIRYNSYEDKTYIWLATPVITTEY